MKNFDMTAALEMLKNEIIADYETWQTCGGKRTRTEVQARMLDEFINSFRFDFGKKYVKIVKEGGGVWGFVVNTTDDKKFRLGDILKAASWSTPARNAARGNVFEDYTVQWTGPLYLK